MWRPARLDPEKPLYLAIADAIETAIGNGALPPGSQLPTQRELAASCGVNLSTMTRAFKECERRGLLSGTVGRGTFVSADSGTTFQLGPAQADSPPLIEMGLTLPLYAFESRLAKALRAILASLPLERLLRYTDPRGLPEHREVGAGWLARYGLETRTEDILITAGSTSALSCCFIAFLRSGDHLAVDTLTYPGIKTLASATGVRLEAIEMDSQGMVPEALEAACKRASIRAVYLMPDAQNPTTAIMGEKRRDQIAAAIGRRKLILIEDDAYGDSSDRHLRALSSRIPDRSAFIAGTSKFMGAGLRTAFVAARGQIGERLEQAILATLWMASPLNAAAVAGLIASGVAQEVLQLKRAEAKRRVDLARSLLPGKEFHCQDSGFFGWLELSRPWGGREFELAAREAGVRVFCADKFAAGSEAPSAVRLSLTGPRTIQELAKGLKALATLRASDPRGRQALM
jgi:DNA-binding transcriptional MocR family regulator